MTQRTVATRQMLCSRQLNDVQISEHVVALVWNLPTLLSEVSAVPAMEFFHSLCYMISRMDGSYCVIQLYTALMTNDDAVDTRHVS